MPSETLPSFGGFSSENHDLIRLPGAFFTQLLPVIDDLSQLRLLLYFFWHLEQQESKVRYFKWGEMVADPALVRMVGGEKTLKKALQALVEYGAVLEANLEWMNERYYFINGPQGRAAIDAIQRGEWQGSTTDRPAIQLTEEQPNIFKLYEENIGAITPMMAEILKQDEADYPSAWIEEAIRIAVKRNARNWKYVQAILNRWQKEGRGNGQNRRDDSQDPGSYRESWLGKD
ncbi:MAG: DnaD domain protein [Chloroflexota bacterium]|nr:DnaD domain protein [Chloroflexota bacterium]